MLQMRDNFLPDIPGKCHETSYPKTTSRSNNDMTVFKQPDPGEHRTQPEKAPPGLTAPPANSAGEVPAPVKGVPDGYCFSMDFGRDAKGIRSHGIPSAEQPAARRAKEACLRCRLNKKKVIELAAVKRRESVTNAI